MARNYFPQRKQQVLRKALSWNKFSILRTEGHGSGYGQTLDGLRWTHSCMPRNGSYCVLLDLAKGFDFIQEQYKVLGRV